MLDSAQISLTDHQRAILGVVLGNPGIRRAEISERLDISPQTTMRAVNPMVDYGILKERQIASIGRGKPANGLRYCKGSLLTMGISLAVDRVRVCISDLSGKKVSSSKISKAYTSSKQQLADLDHEIEKVQSKALGRGSLVGIGVSVQGYFLKERTRFAAKADPFGWAATDLRGHLQEKLRVPVRLMNDGRTLAASLLTATQSTDFLCIHIGSGIGGGVVLDGSLIEGVHGNAGEIGQLFPKNDDRPTEPHFLQAAGCRTWKKWPGLDCGSADDMARFDTFLESAAVKIGHAIETALVLLDFEEVYICSRMPAEVLHELCARAKVAPLGTDIAGPDERLLNPAPKIHPHHVSNHAKLACQMAVEAFLSPIDTSNQ